MVCAFNLSGDPQNYDTDSLINFSACPVLARVVRASIEKFTVCVGFSAGFDVPPTMPNG